MARLPADRYTAPWGDADDCPCGSRTAFVNCCKNGRALPYVRVPSLYPPGQKTNFSHPRCYMGPTANCSDALSREHYVSETILRRFDNISVSGMPWQGIDDHKIYPAKALTANVLCTRHNSALSPIDDMGGRAFDAFVWSADYALSQRHPGRARHDLISGEGLELWMFKLLAGIHYGGIATTDRKLLRDTHTFPVTELISALTTGQLPNGANLWIVEKLGVVQRGQIAIGPIVNTANDQTIGVQVQLGAIGLEVTLVAPPVPAAHIRRMASQRRPRVIDFSGPVRDARVVLSWPGASRSVQRYVVNVAP